LCAGQDSAFDFISVTPPYTQVDYGILMDQISKSPIVGEDTFIVSVSFVQLFNLVYTVCARLFLNIKKFHGVR
jgi:hypothetical protein